MRTRIGAVMICLLLAVSACTKPPAPPEEAKSPPPPAPVAVAPRLLLNLPLGDEPDEPGSMPGRVGGISARGPLAFAAEWGEIFLVDQAKGRILHYRDGQLAGSLPVPWLDEQSVDLRTSPLGMMLTSAGVQYVLQGGWLAGIHPLVGSPPAADSGKGSTTLLGKDGQENRYELAAGDDTPMARRVSKDGTVLNVADLMGIGESRDWYMGRDGALYAMTWQWGQDRVERVKIYEIFPTVTFSSPGGGADPAAPPVVLGRPIPARIRIRLPDWAPLEPGSETERWNLWWLLATATPTTETPAGRPNWQATIEGGFPDGSTLTYTIQDDDVVVDGKRYRLATPRELRRMIEALRLSEQGLKGALKAAQHVRIAIDDLPGVELELTQPQRQLLEGSFTGAMPVSLHTPPQPLERPFPQYSIRLEGAGWKGTLLLAGYRHLLHPATSAAVHGSRTATFVQGWLPVPSLSPDQVGYLYLADRLEIGQGTDLTRWKNTVVRQLVNARVDPTVRPAFSEPLTLTFFVKGKQLTVAVDTGGFTYGGQRYAGSGLTGIASLQGVP